MVMSLGTCGRTEGPRLLSKNLSLGVQYLHANPITAARGMLRLGLTGLLRSISWSRKCSQGQSGDPKTIAVKASRTEGWVVLEGS